MQKERERETVLDEQRTKPSMALGLLCQSKKQITFGTHTHTNWHINWQHSCSGLLYGSRKQMQFGLAKDTYFVSARCKYSLRSIAIPQNVAFIKAATETKPFQSLHSQRITLKQQQVMLCLFEYIVHIYSHDIFSLLRPFALLYAPPYP